MYVGRMEDAGEMQAGDGMDDHQASTLEIHIRRSRYSSIADSVHPPGQFHCGTDSTETDKDCDLNRHRTL
jgi:hypothetical protein